MWAERKYRPIPALTRTGLYVNPATQPPQDDSTEYIEPVQTLKSARSDHLEQRHIENALGQFAVTMPFTMDLFQEDAIRTLLAGDSVMVAAPTGSGKTVVAEFGVYYAFRGAGRVLYTTPIKALSNQKYRDLREIYGDDVGLLTGDVTENREARILVMTTEILRNMLLQSPWEMDDVDAVIFDEIHYLADQERGTTWEEAIILCPEHVQLICLSATVTNAEEIAQWIGRTHRPIRLITHLQRPVPLALYYFNDKALHEVVDHLGNLVADFPHTGGEAKRRAARSTDGRRGRENRSDDGAEEPQPHEIIDALATGDMLPAIYFLFSRADCQTYAERLAQMRPNLVDKSGQRKIRKVINRYLDALRPEDRELEQVQLITRLAQVGVGFHHAGLLPILKQLVESLFGSGLMQVVFATDTLALGVNMPARTVVIGRMSKWDGRRRRPLIPNEFQQMAGRAGRRGMDAFGHVVVPYSPWMSFREMLTVATGDLEPVRSSFAVRYNTVLHLWDPPDGHRVRQMLRQSLAQFQASQRIRHLEHDIIEIGGDIAGVPKGCLIGLDAGDELLEDYRRVIALLITAEQSGRRLDKQLADMQRMSTRTPWGEVSRHALRKLFRHAPPGLVLYHRTRGWGVFVARAEGSGGIGLTIFGEELIHLSDYRHVVFVSDQVRIPVEDDLVLSVLSGIQPAKADLTEVSSQLANVTLPDVAAQMEEHEKRQRALIQDDVQRAESELAESTSILAALSEERDHHPCHPCPRRKEHREYLLRIERLDQERTGLEELLVRETEAEEQRVQSVLWGIREVLHRFGYMRRGYATEKADMLAGVFDTDGLILCEFVDRGLLADLSPEDISEVFSWYSYDRDFRYANQFTLPPHFTPLRRRIEEIERAVMSEEREHSLFISAGHNPSFFGPARAWCLGKTMIEITETIELSEGDLVLTFNKTIDLVKQVREMLEDVKPEQALIPTLRKAEKLLCRGIVEQSLNLGFAPIEAAPESIAATP
jgi:ATP-dependent RNA helicase HelY